MYVCMYQVSPGISKQVQAHLAKWNSVQFNSPTVQFSSLLTRVKLTLCSVLFLPSFGIQLN